MKKKEKNNAKKVRQYLMVHSLVDSAQIWNWRCPFPRRFAWKNLFLFGDCQVTDA